MLERDVVERETHAGKRYVLGRVFLWKEAKAHKDLNKIHYCIINQFLYNFCTENLPIGQVAVYSSWLYPQPYNLNSFNMDMTTHNKDPEMHDGE